MTQNPFNSCQLHGRRCERTEAIQSQISNADRGSPQRPRDDAAPLFNQISNKLLKAAAKSPIYFYRYAISPLIGQRCRHLPTCSQYALDAIDINGVWVGGWLALGRIARCHPWGTSGYDPAPDVRDADIPFWMPWRYFRYRRSVSQE